MMSFDMRGCLGIKPLGWLLSSACAERAGIPLCSMMLAHVFLLAFLFLVFSPFFLSPSRFPSVPSCLCYSQMLKFSNSPLMWPHTRLHAFVSKATARLTAQDQCHQLMTRNSRVCCMQLAQYMICFSPSCPLFRFCFDYGLASTCA